MPKEKEDTIDVDEHADGTAVVRGDGIEDDEDDKEAHVAGHEDDDDGDDGAGDDAAPVQHADDADDDANAGDKPGKTRRDQRAARRERQREKQAAAQRELQAVRDQNAALAARLANIEQRGVSTDMAQLDAQIRQRVEAVTYYRNLIAEAASRQDGKTVADATDKLFTVRTEGERLVAHKNAILEQQRAQANRPASTDPNVLAHASRWAERNRWYDPQRGDLDSRIVFEIDKEVASAGFTPNSKQYWDELDARIAKHLPHRAARPANANTGRSPVEGSGRESGTGKGGGITLSAERVKAIKDAGMWNDEAQRTAMIRSYMKYDKEQAKGARQ